MTSGIEAERLFITVDDTQKGNEDDALQDVARGELQQCRQA